MQHPLSEQIPQFRSLVHFRALALFSGRKKTIPTTLTLHCRMASVYSTEDVKKHNKKKDLWIMIHNNVYDVTDFIQEVSLHTQKRAITSSFEICINPQCYGTASRRYFELYGNITGFNRC